VGVPDVLSPILARLVEKGGKGGAPMRMFKVRRFDALQLQPDDANIEAVMAQAKLLGGFRESGPSEFNEVPEILIK
jgi:hypothetical protein